MNKNNVQSQINSRTDIGSNILKRYVSNKKSLVFLLVFFLLFVINNFNGRYQAAAAGPEIFSTCLATIGPVETLDPALSGLLEKILTNELPIFTEEESAEIVKAFFFKIKGYPLTPQQNALLEFIKKSPSYPKLAELIDQQKKKIAAVVQPVVIGEGRAVLPSLSPRQLEILNNNISPLVELENQQKGINMDIASARKRIKVLEKRKIGLAPTVSSTLVEVQGELKRLKSKVRSLLDFNRSLSDKIIKATSDLKAVIRKSGLPASQQSELFGFLIGLRQDMLVRKIKTTGRVVGRISHQPKVYSASLKRLSRGPVALILGACLIGLETAVEAACPSPQAPPSTEGEGLPELKPKHKPEQLPRIE